MLISELSVVEGKKVAEVEKNLENLFKNENK